uniref:NADH dehydrogenase [ubiquinone] 1 beta subcomplex subunit 4 n=1 Tax=Pelusios castaneus TaxID=367368 RepID=A0A8C8S4F2_9SAUR
MAGSESASSGPPLHYRAAPLVPLPRELDPAEYDQTPAKRLAEAERLANRARLKRQFQLQLNNPHRADLIEDPAMLRWTYARIHNIYPTTRTTPKTSLLGLLAGVLPIAVLWYALKTERDYKEKLTQEGKYERNFRLYY